MATTTLKQFWIDEVALLTAHSDAQRDAAKAARTAFTDAQTEMKRAAEAVRVKAGDVDRARKALAAIPTPADGDPLLTAMEQALIALADAEADLASADLAVQTLAADLAQKEARAAVLEAALRDAKQRSTGAAKAADDRETLAVAITTGELANVATEAQAALATYETNARARVEAEFPSSATAAESFLGRARARRKIVSDSLGAASAVETAAAQAGTSPVAQARAAFDAAVAAVASVAGAAPRLEADRATLQRLAELPAPTTTTFPILTLSQHEHLHDAGKQAAREAALSKLTDVDKAAVDLRAVEKAYDLALHAAMRANPDKTRAELVAGPVKTEYEAIGTRRTDLTTAAGKISAEELSVVKAWFAAVPPTLWTALDQLDAALVRLKSLAGPPAPAALVTALTTAEAALTAALVAEALELRKQEAADLALRRASSLFAAERETAPARALAYEHGAALFKPSTRNPP
jgi:hypothetical protein